MDGNEEGGFYTYEEALRKFGDKLPTKEQFEELWSRCQWTWDDIGYIVTGPNGNSITLPAAGYRHCGESIDYVASRGCYWSSTPSGLENAYDLYFKSDSVVMDHDRRCDGYSVRLVQK